MNHPIKMYIRLSNSYSLFLRPCDSVTDSNGRCSDLCIPAAGAEGDAKKFELVAGRLYKVVFKTKEYFDGSGGRKCFYPWVEVSGDMSIMHTCAEAQAVDSFRGRESGRTLSYPFASQPVFVYDLQRQLDVDYTWATMYDVYQVLACLIYQHKLQQTCMCIDSYVRSCRTYSVCFYARFAITDIWGLHS